MSPLRGLIGILIPYSITVAGLIVGLRRGGASWRDAIVGSPLVSIGVLFGAGILWMFVGDWLRPLVGVTLNNVLGLMAYFASGVAVGRWRMRARPDWGFQRGTYIVGGAPPRPDAGGAAATLTLAGFPVAPLDETKHFKLIGTTGTGKSTAIREILAAALARGDRAVIADPDGSYTRRFYDAERGDVILNPLDPRAARWDLFAEMQTQFDADQIALSLIPDAEGNEKPWRTYARVLLASMLRQLHRVKHQDIGELVRLLFHTPVEDLRELLTDTTAGPYLTEDSGKFFTSVRAVAATHLAALEHVAQQQATRTLSVREWIRGGKPGRAQVLFLPYAANQIATLRNLISTWMRLAIFETLSQPEGDHRLWFVVDELDALGPIDGMKDALARLRKVGGRCVLGFQSIAQVSGPYGHTDGQTIVENCGNTLILRCSAADGGGTARFASTLIGQREVVREQATRHRHRTEWFTSRSFTEHRVTESAVLPSEIEQLADLQGYLKFASTPVWRRVRLRMVE